MSSTEAMMAHSQGTRRAGGEQQFGFDEARQIGDALGVPWDTFDVDQFRMGLNMELQHGRHENVTGNTDDELLATGRIALAHLNEIPDYYTQLAVMIGSSLSNVHSFRFLLVHETPG